MSTHSSGILIVDDDPALLDALSGALRLCMPDVAVDACDSGQAAIEKIAQTDYDAIVSDIKMPGMDGLALLKRIREIQPDVPTLLITGHGQHDLAVQALRGGAFDFIQKPIDRDYFVASLTRAIRVRKMDRQLQRQQQELASHADKLEQVVEARTKELRELNRRKDEFLAVLSHELRNPLACILSAAELTLLPESDPRLEAESCRTIAQQAGHMRRLLDDLLDLSRINRNKIGLRKEYVRLCDVIDAAVNSTRSLMRERRHTLKLDMDPLTLGHVRADPARLEQVIVNLLTNAAKYSDPGAHVRLSAERYQGDVVIAVADNGIGIPDTALPTIFEPFVQVDATGTRDEGGLGIGLALVRQLVELHGGSVTAASEGRQRGSCFTVRLPIGIETVPAAAEKEPSRRTGRRVLLVEDQVSLALLTCKLLERAGQQVVAIANDGPTALEAAATHLPDVILLDIGLPCMNGYEVAQRIRQIPELSDAVLVAMTGYGTSEDRKRAKDSGFDFHLVKPCAYESLIECIEQASSQRQGAATSRY